MAPGRFPWIAVSLVLASGAIQSSSELTHWLEFDVNASLHGELWRLFTGHLCHYNRSHFVGDVAAFLVWAGAVELLSRRLLVMALVGTPLTLSAWLFTTGAPGLIYRGVSAIDCALAVQLFTTALLSKPVRHNAWLTGALVGIAVVMALKSAYEFTTGHAVLAPELGRQVRLLPSAHVLGVLVGAVTAYWQSARGLGPGSPTSSLCCRLSGLAALRHRLRPR